MNTRLVVLLAIMGGLMAVSVGGINILGSERCITLCGSGTNASVNGTVTTVNTGYGLTGGPITSSGNLSAVFSQFADSHTHNAINLTNVGFLDNRILVDASNITAGTISDDRLSTDVCQLSLNNYFTNGTNHFRAINATQINGTSLNGNHSAPTNTSRGGLYQQSCTGTDKQTGINSNGLITCATDQTGAGGSSREFLLAGGSSGAIAADNTCTPNGDTCVATATNGMRIPIAMTINNLSARIDTAPAVGNICVFTVRNSSGACTTYSATNLSCAVQTGATSCSNTTFAATISANSCLQIFYDEQTVCTGLISWGFLAR